MPTEKSLNLKEHLSIIELAYEPVALISGVCNSVFCVKLKTGVRKAMPSVAFINWQPSTLLYSLQVFVLANSMPVDVFSKTMFWMVVRKEFSTLIVALINLKPEMKAFCEDV